MKRDRASRTAEMVALVRDRGAIDPYAERFLGPTARLTRATLARLDPRNTALDLITIGLSAAVRARHRWLDGLVVEALAHDARQVVLLGAGFDARPWRLADAIDGQPVFLVDHPATARARAERAPDPPPNVRRVDVVFDEADFADALDVAGFDWTVPAVFIWEGVTMYLDLPVIESTLSRIAHRAAAGTRIGLDLVVQPTGREPHALERVAKALLASVGEPIRTIVPEDELEAIFSRSGLAVRQTVPAPQTRGEPQAWEGLWFIEAAC